MPLTDPVEPILIQRAQQGEEAALAELYQRHTPAIFRYFFFRVNDQALAEDLTGEVFMHMVEALPRYVERGVPFAAWLFRIAHARLVDHHRRAAHRPTESLTETHPDHAPSPEDQAHSLAEARRLKKAIALLTEEQQTVIQLRFVEGYSLEETARMMGKTTGAIKAMQHRALNRLARQLNQ